ncbi:uncharacterized protein LOC112203005 [Rosa chinensis]|uniref:uncharacterized protein LOC112203005 n=1 Tax=Rosa chinensis TaxID=74649 RepID=UPI001AD942B7|nr:uncharacterized protein LOC112203005 [Rosa chinensis]
MEEIDDAVIELSILLESSHKEQQQDDNESSQSGVGLETTENYTNQFTTNQIFESKDALLQWVRSIGKKNNMVIIIRRSDTGAVGNKKKRPKLRFCCERGGDYKRVVKSSTNTEKSNAESKEKADGSSKKKERPRASGTKKCGCPFALRGINIVGDEWMLEVTCGVHNHPHSQSLHGHSYVGRLSKEEHAMLVDMTNSLMKPKDILTALKKRDPENVTIMKTIYNVRKVHRMKLMAGRSQMQSLLQKLSEHNYIEHHRSEETEDNYTWALSRLRTLLDHCTLSVFVTDRELALMNSISKIFPDSRHLLCKWHINRNVMKECKKKFATAEMWNMFLNAWNTVVGSTTESEYWANLKEFESKFSTYPDELRYLKRTWLDNYKERFVVAWTDTCMHIGTTTSNRVESAHAKLKRQLNSSQLDFNISWDHIHSLIELHHTDIKASFEKSRCFLQHDFKHEYLKELISYVSIAALNKIVCEANRADSMKKDVACCGCVIRVTHGLPCAHEIAEYKCSNRPIPIDAVHNHWRQLGINQAMHNDTEEKVPVKQHMLRLETWIKQQNDEDRRHLLIKIDELMNPVGQDVPHGPIISIQNTTSSKKPKDCTTKIKSPEDTRFALTNKYNLQFRVGMQPYIVGAYDVESDGNCGYRVVASAMGFGRKSWRKVRRDLLNELHSMRELYVILFGGTEVEKVQQTLNHYGSGNAAEKYWMYFPEMGHLIATCYGVVVIFLSEGQCITFLPLVEHKIGQFSNDELKEIGIGHVNKNHFVHLKLSLGHPLPYLVPNWERNADVKVRHLFSIYQDRLNRFKECCPRKDDGTVTQTTDVVVTVVRNFVNFTKFHLYGYLLAEERIHDRTHRNIGIKNKCSETRELRRTVLGVNWQPPGHSLDTHLCHPYAGRTAIQASKTSVVNPSVSLLLPSESCRNPFSLHVLLSFSEPAIVVNIKVYLALGVSRLFSTEDLLSVLFWKGYKAHVEINRGRTFCTHEPISNNTGKVPIKDHGEMTSRIPELDALLSSGCSLQEAVKILEGWINICLKFESPEAHEDKLLIGDFVFDFEIELGRPLPLCSYLTLRYLNHNLNAFFCLFFFVAYPRPNLVDL